MTSGELSEAISAAFPVKPIPERFWIDDRQQPSGDIPDELSKRIAYRPWSDVTMLDWRMVGASPAVSSQYLDPATFAYYLPSIVLGVYPGLDFVEYALESILPRNQNHVPRGRWWAEFADAISQQQRRALATFLEDIRRNAWETIGSANQYFLEVAENIWLHP